MLNILFEELTHWKRPWCWEGLGAGGGDDRGWDGWMASPTWCTWVWVNSGSWWWSGRPGVLRFMRSQRVGHNWATGLNWTELTHPTDDGGLFSEIKLLFCLRTEHVWLEFGRDYPTQIQIRWSTFHLYRIETHFGNVFFPSFCTYKWYMKSEFSSFKPPLSSAGDGGHGFYSLSPNPPSCYDNIYDVIGKHTGWKSKTSW